MILPGKSNKNQKTTYKQVSRIQEPNFKHPKISNNDYSGNLKLVFFEVFKFFTQSDRFAL